MTLGDKIVYLDKLVEVYSKMLVLWDSYEIKIRSKKIKIKYIKHLVIDNKKYINFTARDYPLEFIDKVILSYKGKISREFKNRHKKASLKEILKQKE